MSWPDYPSGFIANLDTALNCANFIQQAYFQLFVNAGTPPPPFGFGSPSGSYPGSYPLQMPPIPLNSSATTSPYTVQYTIQYEGESKPYDYFGYVITGPSLINSGNTMAAFVLRGTESSMEWVDDILLSEQSAFYGSGSSSLGQVHSGFSSIYGDGTASSSGLRYVTSSGSSSSLSDVLYNTTNISADATDLLITGHSLGGALATLLAIDIAANQAALYNYFNNVLTCYTFGSPRVGDPVTFVPNFNNYVSNGNIVHYRVANGLDIVPGLPPNVYYDPFSGNAEYDYEAVNNFCPVDSGLVDFDFHSLNSYAAGLNNLLTPPASLAVPRRTTRRRPARVKRSPIGAVPPNLLPAPPPKA